MTVPEYDEVYAALWPRLVRTAYAVSGDLGVAEDAVQTAFAKAYRSWRRISRMEAPVAYLRKMAVNEVLNDRRLARRRHEITSDEPPERAVAGSPDDALAHDEMWRAISSLPPRQRAVLVLALLRGPQRAADRRGLGCRPGTVKSQASAALATLRTRRGPPEPSRRGAVMDVEQQMRETYAERLGAVELSGGDVDAARRTGARMRVRRRLAVGAAAVAVVVAVGVGGTSPRPATRLSARRPARPLARAARRRRSRPGPTR